MQIKILILSVIFEISFLLSSALDQDKFLRFELKDVFGLEYDTDFKGFDVIWSGSIDTLGQIGNNLGGHDHREIAQVYHANSTQKQVQDMPMWTAIHKYTELNRTLAVLINLYSLKSLGITLSDIKDFYRETPEYFQKPYFFLIYSQLVSNEEEIGLLSNLEMAKDLSIDKDVYLVYWQCNLNTAKGSSKSRDIETDLCPSKKAEIKILEFYSIGIQYFIKQIQFKDLHLVQKVIRRTDFQNAPLFTIAAYGYPHRVNFSKNNDSFVNGYEAEQIKFLGDSYNLSIKAGIARGWIGLSPNNSLTGMGAQIINGEADISISASEMLPYRVDKLGFLHPTYYTRLWGFFVQPPSSSFRDIFIHAFTGDLWFTMFSTWILIVLAMGALAIVKIRLETMHDHDSILIQELFIWAAGAICQQGWHVCPESTCMKIIFIFALITGLVSYVAYSAALVSILSVKVVPIKNLNDIVAHGYQIFQDNQTINAQYVIQKLESEGLIPCMSIKDRSIRSETALPKILSYSSAFIGASDFFYPVARGNMSDTIICDLISRISISARPIRGGMFIKKGSPLKDFFNHKLLIMYERGIRFRLLENYFRDTSVMCLEKTGSTKDPLGFNDVYTAFVILLLGYCLSFAIFLVEMMFPPEQHDREMLTVQTKRYFNKVWNGLMGVTDVLK